MVHSYLNPMQSLLRNQQQQENGMKLTLLTWQFCCCYLLAFPLYLHANQIESLRRLINSRKSNNPPNDDLWPEFETNKYIPIDISPQYGSMEADRIGALPGQPDGSVNFKQYSGYVTVDVDAGSALFYYFVESPQNSTTNPLLLWLNGGPGCSSVGIGAMEEIGPFHVNSNKKNLYSNPYAWNNVANVIFLDSPAGVGYSYSNTTLEYGDKNTARDSYTFLINWLERFPQYKTRDFYVAGESYAGHYIPQLAYTILLNNKNAKNRVINLKGIAIGNGLVDEETWETGQYDYYWSHALNSDETHTDIHKFCEKNLTSNGCQDAQQKGDDEMEMERLDVYNVYAPTCPLEKHDIKHRTKGSVRHYDPCVDVFTLEYLNLPEVQKSFHVNLTAPYYLCSQINWKDGPRTILPVIKQLMSTNISIWLYSGDQDGQIPVTSTRYAINSLKLPIKEAWRPWYKNEEVGGYVVEYENLVFLTVRGAGHEVPSFQPERALVMVSSFLKGKLPPK